MRAIRTPFRLNPARLDPARLQTMRQGGEMMLTAHKALQKRGQNVVASVGPKDGRFSLWDAYPADPIADAARRYLYYYHAHRTHPKEHGHFHLFSLLQADGTLRPEQTQSDNEAATSHLLAIGMNKDGLPTGIFSTNLWVTSGYWLPADEVMARLANFAVDNSRRQVQVSRWLCGFVQLFWPQIETLLKARDRQVEQWRGEREWHKFWEDQSIEVINYIPVDFAKQTGLLFP